MFTLTPYELVFDSLSAVLIIVLSVAVYRLQKYRPQSVSKKKVKKSETQAGRDLEIGNQAGRDVIIKKQRSKPCERELLLFATLKDVQNSNNLLLGQLADKDRTIERYDREFLRLQNQKEKLREENDALWDENTRIKYEQLANRFPVLELKPIPMEAPTPAETKVA